MKNISISYKIKNWIHLWIYPADYLRNLLFDRYDYVKIPIKKYQYIDKADAVPLVLFKMLIDFYEREWKETILEKDPKFDKIIEEIYPYCKKQYLLTGIESGYISVNSKTLPEIIEFITHDNTFSIEETKEKIRKQEYFTSYEEDKKVCLKIIKIYPALWT